MDDRKKVVLITGAAGGIGRAVVSLFNNKGWVVIGVDRQEFGSDFPSDGLFIHSDISEPRDIEVIYTKTREFSQFLDVVVNNAAIQISKSILDMSVEEWDASMASNLRSVFLGVKLAHPLLKMAGGGAIVNVSSVHAVATSANISAYAASKGGLLALTRAMAIEFAPDGIRVNAVLPGAVDTPMLRESMKRSLFGYATIQGRLDNLAGKTVNGRIGKPSSFMTGQALIVDGGATARLSTE